MDVKTIERDSYPWASLFEDDVIGSDLPVDPHALVDTVKTSEFKIAELSAEVTKQRKLVESQDEHIQAQKGKLLQMKEVSTKTFDSLQARVLRVESELEAKVTEISHVTELNTQLKASLVEITTQLQQVTTQKPDDVYAELIYQVLIYNIVNHKAGLSAEATREKTLYSAVRWLKQRRNVVDYLRRHKLHADTADDLENILFVDEKTLNGILDRLVI